MGKLPQWLGKSTLLHTGSGGPVETFRLRLKTESRLGFGGSENQPGHVLAYRGTMFKAMAGTTAGEPGAVQFGVAIKEVVSVGGVFVLADAGFEEWGIGHGGNALAKIGTGLFDGSGRDDALGGIGINDLPTLVVGDLEAAAFEIGKPIELALDVDPAGHLAVPKEGASGRSSKEQHILASGQNPGGEQLREDLAEPRAAGVDDVCGIEIAWCDVPLLIADAGGGEQAHEGLDGAPR